MLSPLQAQKPGVHKATPAEIKKEDKKKAEPTEPVPFYQGTSIGVEIAGLGSYLLGSDILNTEIAVQANLKNRFLPVIEVGYGSKEQKSCNAICFHHLWHLPFRIPLQ